MTTPKHHGTLDSCSYCKKKFGPSHTVTRKNVHIVFRVRTQFATFYGPTHGPCVERLTELELPGI